jgi:hypothetical protein
MKPLTPDDLLPLTEYASRRREFHAQRLAYLDRYRRVRIGPNVILSFENRQTLWFRVQDLICTARLTDPALVQQELDLYNRLLPKRNELQAAFFWQNSGDLGQPSGLLDLADDQVRLAFGSHESRAKVVTCRPEDRCDGTAYWLLFAITPEARQSFAESRQPVRVGLSRRDYRLPEVALSEEVRQSLIDDLMLSDKDEN